MKNIFLILIFITSSFNFTYGQNPQNVQKLKSDGVTTEDFFPIGWYTRMVIPELENSSDLLWKPCYEIPCVCTSAVPPVNPCPYDLNNGESNTDTFGYLNDIGDDGFSNTIVALVGFYYNQDMIIDYFGKAEDKNLNIIMPILNGWLGFLKTENLGMLDETIGPHPCTAGWEVRNNDHISNLLDMPNLLGWYLYDEPSLTTWLDKYNSFPSNIKAMNDRIKNDFDDIRPTFIAACRREFLDRDYSLSPGDVGYVEPSIDGYNFIDDGELPDAATKYYQNTDIIMLDIYTIMRNKYKYFYSDISDRSNYITSMELFPKTMLRLPKEINSAVTDDFNATLKKPIIAVLQAETELTCMYKVLREGENGIPDYVNGKPIDKDGNKIDSSLDDPWSQFIYLKSDYRTYALDHYTNYKEIEAERGILGEKGLYYCELLYNHYTSIVHGAKGIIYFAMCHANEDMKTNINNIGKTFVGLNLHNMQLGDKLPCVCSDISNSDKNDYDSYGKDLIDINYSLKFNDSANGGDDCYYLIAVNDSEESINDVEFTLPFKVSTESDAVMHYNFAKGNEFNESVPYQFFSNHGSSNYKNFESTNMSIIRNVDFTKFEVKMFRIIPKNATVIDVEEYESDIIGDPNNPWNSDKVRWIRDDINISGTLNINSGCVFFDVDKNTGESYKLTVNGTLNADGTPTDKIGFVTNDNTFYKTNLDNTVITGFKNLIIEETTIENSLINVK